MESSLCDRHEALHPDFLYYQLFFVDDNMEVNSMSREAESLWKSVCLLSHSKGPPANIQKITDYKISPFDPDFSRHQINKNTKILLHSSLGIINNKSKHMFSA